MCFNTIKDSEMVNTPVYVDEQPFTKSFGYTKVYYYGDTDNKVEIKENRSYVVNSAFPSDLPAILLQEINDIFDTELNSPSHKDGYVLRAVQAFIINLDALSDHDNEDENDNIATAQIILYQIGKDRTAFLNTQCIQAHCFRVFYSDEDDSSSDEYSDWYISKSSDTNITIHRFCDYIYVYMVLFQQIIVASEASDSIFTMFYILHKV